MRLSPMPWLSVAIAPTLHRVFVRSSLHQISDVSRRKEMPTIGRIVVR